MPAIVDLVNRSYQQDGNMDEVRYWMLKQIAPKSLAHPRGSKFDYSNLGYTFAGAMLERVGKKTWEELVEDRIIQQLGLKTAGFGPQSSLGKVDAPLDHVLVNGIPKAMLAGPNGDNHLIIGPAGTMHMSVLDFAQWVAWNAGKGKRPPALVSPAILKKIHTPVSILASARTRRPVLPSRANMRSAWESSRNHGPMPPALRMTDRIP
jgi:CubicO group peptidase (beta-lactamase class C family)